MSNSAPGSYLVMDPGRVMGFASCLSGGGKLKHGTWRFSQKPAGAAYAEFISYLKRMLSDMPDPLIGMELMTIVSHGEGDDTRIDAEQVMFSSGWPTHAQTIAHIMGLREPEFLPIQTWRSKTHGCTRSPESMKNEKPSVRQAWLKAKAKAYCDRNGWSYDTEDEAEALCMLDAMRIIHEPGYAFDKGKSFEQGSLL